MKQIINAPVTPGISNINQEFEFNKFYVAYKDGQYLFASIVITNDNSTGKHLYSGYCFSDGGRNNAIRLESDIKLLLGPNDNRPEALRQLITKTLSQRYKVYSFDNFTEFVESIRNGNI